MNDLESYARAALHDLRQLSETESDGVADEVFSTLSPIIANMDADVGSDGFRAGVLAALALVESGLASEEFSAEGEGWRLLHGYRIMLLYLAFWPEYWPEPMRLPRPEG